MKSKAELKKKVERYLTVQRELSIEIERLKKEQKKVTLVRE